MAKREAPRPPTLADHVLEALTAARYAYTFFPNSYTHGALVAIMQVMRVVSRSSSSIGQDNGPDHA